MADTLLFIAIGMGSIAVFILFFMGISYLISNIGGWAKLASRYPAAHRAEGKLFNWRSARFRFFMSYSYCLTLIISSDGIYMKPFFFYRIGHKPVMIPWDAIELERRSFVFTTTRLKIMDDDSSELITIIIYETAPADSLEDFYKRHQRLKAGDPT